MTQPRFWRSAGVWMAAAGGLLQLVNAVRAFADPTGFASYFGLPLAATGDAPLIHVYALRTLFIGLLVASLLAARQTRALALFGTVAVVMPVGDALLAGQAGAAATTVARHLAIALFLVATAALLWRQAMRERV